MAKLAGRDFDLFMKARRLGGMVVVKFDQQTLRFGDPYITYRSERDFLNFPTAHAA